MKYVFDRKKLQEAIAPKTLQDLFYAMNLTPSQMQIFFYSEPSVAKILKVKEFTYLDPLTLMKPSIKGEKHESEKPIHESDCLS